MPGPAAWPAVVTAVVGGVDRALCALQYDMLYLSFAVATAVLVLLEYARLVRLPPFGASLHKFMAVYTDARDSGYTIRTHIYLLLGCALPVWLSGTGSTADLGAAADTQEGARAGNALFARHGIEPYAGVIIIGVGDAMAAAVGSMFGRLKWRGTQKTLLGTFAAFTSVLVTAAVIQAANDLMFPDDAPLFPTDPLHAVGFLVASAALCLLEAFTTQVDNLLLPLYFWVLLTLL